MLFKKVTLFAALFGAAVVFSTASRPAAAAETSAAAAQAQDQISIEKIQVGAIPVYAMYDTPQVFDKAIFPKIKTMPERFKMMPNGQFTALTKTYLVQTTGRNVLIDSGWGKDSGLNGLTTDSLAKLGVSTDAVTDILLTHMDVDHISGLLSKGEPTYPNAILHVVRTEYEAWVTRGQDREPEYIALARRVAKAYEGRIQTYEYDDEVIPGITGRAARGHTFGHARWDIDSEGEGLTIVGDMIHVAPLQMRWTDYCSVYDAHPKMAAKTRERVLHEITVDRRIMAAMHVKEIGRVVENPEGGYAFEAWLKN